MYSVEKSTYMIVIINDKEIKINIFPLKDKILNKNDRFLVLSTYHPLLMPK